MIMFNSVYFELLENLSVWLIENAYNVALSVFFSLIVLGFYRLVSGQVERLARDGRLDLNVSFLIRRVLRWGSYFLIAAFVFTQFGFKVDVVAGLVVVAGSTVIGFAAMSTLGNAVAGIIIMTSRPFSIGDRIIFGEEFVDIVAIDLIYTKMRTTDNVAVSVPNQMLLQTEIFDYGREQLTRRRCAVTADYSEEPKRVEEALLEAAARVDGVLDKPGPYVWVTGLGSFAVEYTLHYFLADLKAIQRIDSDLRLAVLETCRSHGIDLQTPSLIRSVK